MMKVITGTMDKARARVASRRGKRMVRFLQQYVTHAANIYGKHCETFTEDDEKDLVPCIVGLVKFFSLLLHDEKKHTEEETIHLWPLYNEVINMAACLSPAKIAQLFPPAKEYNGGGEFKDYFTAIEAVKAAGGHERFKDRDKALELFMDLNNRDTTYCCIMGLNIMDAIRARQGGRSLIETFLEEQTGQPCSLPKSFHEARDKDGNVYVCDDMGNVLGLKAKPRRPKWLRVVSGKE